MITDFFSFKHAIDHRTIMDAYIKNMTDDLTRDGKLKLRPGEQVPNRNYKRHTSYEYLETGHVSASFSQHPTLNFLRRVNVQKAVNELRNLGLFPFKTLPSSMPDGISVDNFAQVKLIFHCYYCYFEGVTIMYETHVLKIVYTRFENCIHTFPILHSHVFKNYIHTLSILSILSGLARSSDHAREILVYLFHGSGTLTQTLRGEKTHTIIFEIRKQYMHGLNIFGKASQSFDKLIEYLTIFPAQKMGLTDPKFKVSKKFKAYAEVGLRKLGTLPNTPLGKNAMKSAKHWEQVNHTFWVTFTHEFNNYIHTVWIIYTHEFNYYIHTVWVIYTHEFNYYIHTVWVTYTHVFVNNSIVYTGPLLEKT